MANGRAWPGYAIRFCPVCGRETATHREPVNDERKEVVVYHDHWDGQPGRICLMSGKVAAIRAVTFTQAPIRSRSA